MKIPSTYIIAEAGVNHNGSLRIAMKMVEVAAKAGADAIKFQTFQAKELVTRNTPKASYQKIACPAGKGQLAMLKTLELGEKEHRKLLEHSNKCKIEFISTPFDVQSLRFLVHLGVRKIKIPSGS